MLLGTMSISPTSEAAVAKASSHLFWDQLSKNAPIVGSAWMISSVLYTTYSTTKWLQYQVKDPSSSKINKRLLPSLVRRVEGRETSTRMQNILKSSILKRFLSDRPALLTLYRFSGSLLLGMLLPNPLNCLSKWEQTIKLIPHFLLPALFLFLANYFNSISLNSIGIPLTYTTKCGIPIFTVLVSILVNGSSAIPKLGVWLSLLPIVVGIAAASYNAASWNTVGFLCALASSTSQSALNVISKKVLSDIDVSGVEAQRVMVLAALVFMVIFSGVKSGANIFTQQGKGNEGDNAKTVPFENFPHPPSILTLMAITAYHFEYVLSFTYVSLTEPITYALCDAMRRLGIILSGKAIFGGDRLSRTNKSGIGLAIFGVLLYSIYK